MRRGLTEDDFLTDDDFISLGLHPAEAEVFQSLADSQQYDIFVRAGNDARVANLGRYGMRSKPAAIYQKTNKGDFLPGAVLYPKQDRGKGKNDLRRASSYEPTQSGRSNRLPRTLARERWSLGKLTPDWLGVRDAAGNLVYGDIDLHGVYHHRPGQKRADRIAGRKFVPLFNDELMKTGLYAPSLLRFGTPMVKKKYGVLPHHPIQHGAHDAWPKRNDKKYAGGVNMGPLPRVIHFRPNASAKYLPTVEDYQKALASLGHERTYTADAWKKGINRG